MREPYDALFAIRLDADYEPIERSRHRARRSEAHYGHGRVRWGRAFVADPRVRHITASALAPPCKEPPAA